MAGGETVRTSGGGKIITENEQLLSLLTERSRSSNMAADSPLQKIYVDSPAYDDDDDDKYKYVSTNVDDFDEGQASAFMFRQEPQTLDELVESTDPNNIESRGASGTYRKPNSNRGRFVDEDDEDLAREREYQEGMLRRLTNQGKADQNFNIPRLDLSDEEDNPRDSLDPSLVGPGGGGKIHEISVRDSLDAVEMQTLKDQERLRIIMEDADPRGFNAIIGDNLHQRDPNNPYKLNLNELRETPEPPMNKSQPVPQGDDPRLRGLFQQQQQPPQDPYQYQQGNPDQYQQGTPHQYQQGTPHQYQQGTPHQYQQGNPHQYQQAPPPPPNDQYIAGTPLQLSRNSSRYAPPANHPPGSSSLQVPNGAANIGGPHSQQSHYVATGVTPSRVTTATTNHWPQSLDPNTPYSQYHQQPYQEQQLGHQAGQTAAPYQNYGYQPQQALQPHPNYAAPPPQGQFYQNQHGPQQQFQYPLETGAQNFNPAIQQGTFRQPVPEEQEPPRQDPYGAEYDAEQSEGDRDSPTLSEMTRNKKDPNYIDYVSRNKKDFSKTIPASKNSYAQVYSTRKKNKESLPPTPFQRRQQQGPPAKTPSKGTNKPRPRLTKDDSSETFVVDENKPPGTAETLWSKRSQALTNRKASSIASSAKKGPQGRTLQKYPSESRVDQIKSVHSAPASKLAPIKSSPRPGSFTEPIKTEVEVDPQDLGKPLRHTVYTDDGQKVSVDINLKLSQASFAPAPPPQFYQAGFQPAMPYQQQGPQGVPGYHQGVPVGAPGPQDWNGYYYQPGLPPHPQQLTQQLQQVQQQQQQITQGHDEYNDPVYYQQYNADRGTPMSQRSNQVGSPFKVLPPIGSADSHGRGETARIDTGQQPSPSGRKQKKNHPPQRQAPDYGFTPPKDNSSYLREMKRVQNRKPVEFKQYTVEDYKKLKREVKLGGLGPDLDSDALRAQREKKERQLEYAQRVKVKNSHRMENAPRAPPDPEPKEEDASGDLLHRRRVAIEYAKSVPKPKVKPQSERQTPVMSEKTPPPQMMTKTTIRPNQRAQNKPPIINEPGAMDLETLRRRHEEEKRQAALIRQQIQAANS